MSEVETGCRNNCTAVFGHLKAYCSVCWNAPVQNLIQQQPHQKQQQQKKSQTVKSNECIDLDLDFTKLKKKTNKKTPPPSKHS